MSEGSHEYAGEYDSSQLTLAATKVAAELVRTSICGTPAVRQDLDSFATAISGRGMGFCAPQLIARVPWCASMAIRNGVTLDNTGQTVRRHGWNLAESASDEEAEKAHFESTLHVVAYRINAFDAKLTGARRAMLPFNSSPSIQFSSVPQKLAGCPNEHYGSR